MIEVERTQGAVIDHASIVQCTFGLHKACHLLLLNSCYVPNEMREWEEEDEINGSLTVQRRAQSRERQGHDIQVL